MCSIVLRIDAAGVLIGANRDEMLARDFDPPGRHWPELPDVVAGRDRTAGGTWLGINRHGMVAAVLNREGTLGPAANKRSRGMLPLLALREASLAAARARLLDLDTGRYRSFNLIVADRGGALFFSGLEAGSPRLQVLDAGCWMITSGEANDRAAPRIARHLPKFAQSPAAAWAGLLADDRPPRESALNIPPHNGFGTVSSALIALPEDGPASWLFAPGPPHLTAFETIRL